MKKILALAMALFVSSSLFAQGNFGIGVRGYVGVPAGSTMHSDMFNSNYRVALFEGVGFGFAASLSVMQEGMKGFGASLELGYAHNEIGWDYSRARYNMTGKLSYSSFDIPLLIGYSFAKGNFRITPHIGPYVSIPIGDLSFDVERVESEDKLVSNKTSTTDLDITSRFIYGGMGGFSVGYKVGHGIVNFDARFMADFPALKVDSGKRGVSVLTRRKTTFGLSYTHYF